MRSVHCVACASRARWDPLRERFTCTACRLSFDASAVDTHYDDEVPDLSAHLETAALPDLSEAGDEDLSAPPWRPGHDVPSERRSPGLKDELVVWKLDLEEDDEATTDGRIG
mgnify:CR=1 FL=1